MFTRWGRVGEQGQKATETGSLQDMKKSFAKKFSDKTKNKWDDVKQDSSKFKFVSGKYDFIETDNTVSKEEAQRLAAAIANKEAAETPKEAENTKVVILPSELSSQVQHLMSLIMNKDTFKNQMKAQNIDADRMPLGKLTKAQVHKGYEALEKIENCLKSKKGAAELGQLCSAFYTIIPHDFGRSVPPLISDSTQLSKKSNC
ncbi:hypothetical protein AGDE_13034 [Angomonas deanei]|uniref:WGR domain/Poly(ADP-ribose) polymerase, regulatory domain containing protein, putative n=1 Tax=Angomonas deanei TaxID=59799 RepID=A0A7G2C777_9TRYP|nr:hypothetical protein AGDE_13034 [Angomonas deanei]CAD2215668.1 WGR domain/Poly(ADP-ribose) polymerase, regulatory domain containing protein, putative [Angomonas deanei]|eukprot:EPY22850.1 hypothetical protein AGDE_13034 [Angomonas deanei]